MSKHLPNLLVTVLIVAVLLSACAPAPTAVPQPTARASGNTTPSSYRWSRGSDGPRRQRAAALPPPSTAP